MTFLEQSFKKTRKEIVWSFELFFYFDHLLNYFDSQGFLEQNMFWYKVTGISACPFSLNSISHIKIKLRNRSWQWQSQFWHIQISDVNDCVKISLKHNSIQRSVKVASSLRNCTLDIYRAAPECAARRHLPSDEEFPVTSQFWKDSCVSILFWQLGIQNNSVTGFLWRPWDLRIRWNNIWNASAACIRSVVIFNFRTDLWSSNSWRCLFIFCKSLRIGYFLGF